MDLSKLRWIKNVKHQSKDKPWAYDNTNEMAIPEAKVFRLKWRGSNSISNAEKPQKGELMLLLQNAKVTHVVEFIDDEVYEDSSHEWGIFRAVKVLWIPPEGFDWEGLPHQQEFFGSEYIVGDGAAHDLAAENRMQQFHQYWDKKGGLETFQNHVENLLMEISSVSK